MLLEREPETAAFARAFARARGGLGAVLAVVAPHGGGRTALLERFAEQARRDGVGALGWVTAIVGERDEEGALAEALLDDLGAGAGPDAESGSAGSADVSLGRRLQVALDVRGGGPGRGAPVVLLVDDLQWADLCSIRALGLLLDVVDRYAVVLVLASADLDPPPGWGDAIAQELRLLLARAGSGRPLRPLSPAAVAALAAGTGELSASAVAELDRAAGNPMLVRAALAAAAAARTAPLADVEDMFRAWLADRFRGPVENLAPPVLDVLVAVVVLGGAQDGEAVGPLAGCDAATTAVALGGLVRLGLVRGPDRPRTVHPALDDAVQQVVGYDDVARRHRLAAEQAYARGAPDRVVADQLIAAGDHSGAWSHEVSRRAARAVLREEGVAAAARYLRAALVAIPPAARERVALLIDLVEAEREFEPAAALLHALQALELAETARERALVLGRLSPSALMAAPSSLAATVRATADALDAAGPGAGEAALRMRAREDYLAFDQPSRLRVAAERFATEHHRLVETAAGREALVVSLHAAVLTMRVRSEEAAELATAILEREAPSPDHAHSALPLLAGTLVAADRLDEVSEWLDGAAAAAEAEDRPVAWRVIAAEQALAAVARGDLAAARCHVATELRLLGGEGTGGPVLAVTVLPLIAAFEDGATTQTVLERFAAIDSSPYAAVGAAFVSGWSAARRGDHRRAADHFRTAGALGDQCGWTNPAVLPWRFGLARSLAASGERDAALHLVAEEQVRAQEWGAPRALGQVLRLRGALVGDQAGLTLLQDAVDVLGRSADRRELAGARVDLGSALHTRGDAAAVEHLRQGREEALACGDDRSAARASALLGETPPASSDPVRGNALTPTERLVAGRVAAGLSNPEIARELGVGLRAVEKHLTRCYRKHGVRGRAELAEVVAGTATSD